MNASVNSVQEACAKCFVYHISIFEILQITWKNETKSIKPLAFSFSPINLAFFLFLICLFMWFAWFQILICELQSIRHKVLLLSRLYTCVSKSEIKSLALNKYFCHIFRNDFSYFRTLCPQPCSACRRLIPKDFSKPIIFNYLSPRASLLTICLLLCKTQQMLSDCHWCEPPRLGQNCVCQVL